MAKPALPPHLEDRIFEMQYSGNDISRITTYFPLDDSERQEICRILGVDSLTYRSIFSDQISDDEWDRTKDRIKKRFGDELFGIDGH